MPKKINWKLLIFSVSLLLLLITVYSYLNGGVKHDSDKPTAATVVIELAHKTGDWFHRTGEKIHDKFEEWQYERSLKRALKTIPERIAEETVKTVYIKNIDFHLAKYSPELLITDADYEDPVDILIPTGVVVPQSVDGTDFRPSKELVFATTEAGLYESPAFEGEPVRRTEMWEEFLRVGISEDCCYQLVSMSGELLYGNGTNFLRNREDMPLTEDINLNEERVSLDVKYISQFPSLPNGCEITSLATVLKFYGYDEDKDALARDYLNKNEVGKANFYKEFVGDPGQRNSFGCYAPVIVEAANAYLDSAGSPMKAVDLTGSSFEDLLLKVREGSPVIVWGAANISNEPVLSIEWIVDGEYLVWKTNLHCMVLIGYDTREKTVIVSDPMRGIKEYDMAAFIKRYKQFYSQAVVLD